MIYNHSDSYPEALGVEILSELKAVPDWDEAKAMASSLIGIPETRELPGLDRMFETEVRRHMPDTVKAENPATLYDLYQPIQGTLAPYLDGRLRFVPTANDFIYDSLFCEWGYIANLDTDTFEVWRGLQQEPFQGENRYGTEADRTGYVPCRPLLNYSLKTDLPSNDEFLDAANRYRHS